MNTLEEALEKLDLKGLLVLNGIIIQQALSIILSAEDITNKLKVSTMGKGNKPQKNDKASKKPKKLGTKKASTGISIFGDKKPSM